MTELSNAWIAPISFVGAEKPGCASGAARELYPFEPAMTTWKFSRYWPVLVAEALVIGRPQREHL